MASLTYSSSDDSDYEEPKTKKKYRERINFNELSNFGFKEKFRLCSEDVEYVLEKIGSKLLHKTTKNKALTPDQQLLTALHWLGNGGQYHGVADMHGLSKATVCRTLKNVVSLIVSDMFQEVVQWPSCCENIAYEFQKKGGFPAVCGAADGVIVNIDKPTKNEVAFIDRHGDHSINSLMVAGPDYMFYYVSSRWPGSVHDSRVLRNSSLASRFESGWRPFPDAVILGDSAYGLREWLIPPVFNEPDDYAEANFNRAHKSTRRFVECAFGILKERFPCLQCLRLNPEFAGMIIMACATLHNIASKDDFEYQPGPEEDPQDPIPETPSEAAKDRLNELLMHFA